MQLLRLCAHQIQLNKPLPWNVRNEPGQLLLGHVLADCGIRVCIFGLVGLLAQALEQLLNQLLLLRGHGIHPLLV